VRFNISRPRRTVEVVFNGTPTVSSNVVWSLTGLSNRPHMLMLSGTNSMGGLHDLNVDGFM